MKVVDREAVTVKQDSSLVMRYLPWRVAEEKWKLWVQIVFVSGFKTLVSWPTVVEKKILEQMSLVLSYAIGDGSTMSQQGLGKSIPTEPLRCTGTSLAMWFVDHQAHQKKCHLPFFTTAELSLKPQAVVDVQWRPSGPVSKWKQVNAWVVGESLSYMIFRFRSPLPSAQRILSRFLLNWLLFASPTFTFIGFYCPFAFRFRPRAFSAIIGGTGDPFFIFELTRTIETLKSMSQPTSHLVREKWAFFLQDGHIKIWCFEKSPAVSWTWPGL